MINRESFTGVVSDKLQPMHDGSFGRGRLAIPMIVLGGDPTLPEDHERGWKDTGVMLPGQVTRVIAKFDKVGRYVWHCHILSHEDHEMMRPYEVLPKPVDQKFTKMFQDGVYPDNNYNGTRDAFIAENKPDYNFGESKILIIDGEDGGFKKRSVSTA